MRKDFNLSCIRLNTEYVLDDAIALADRVFGSADPTLDHATFQFSKELFVAVALITAHEKAGAGMDEMIFFLSDPSWESADQMLQSVRNSSKEFGQKATRDWKIGFNKKIEFGDARTAGLVRQCRLHWQRALGASDSVAAKKTRRRACVKVFEPQSVAAAMARLGGQPEEKRLAAERVLQNALFDDGYRSLPGARKAGLKLEAAKGGFENLAEPIERLQTDLVLAAAMKSKDFHVTPLLLLGEPGIGKTYLATQLADSLGVLTEKISAGGAQGGFQFTGSHTSWSGARPGSIFTLLAEGRSASPVVVIDEVDKIHDAQYPVLPVLLDLLEPNSAKRFKDEFLEITFDASRIIFILTANTLDSVPAPLLSRVEVFNVPRPEAQQRLRIIHCEAEQLRRKTRKNIWLDDAGCLALSERMDIDLRKIVRLVKESFAHAIKCGESVARVACPKPEGFRFMGFQP